MRKRRNRKEKRTKENEITGQLIKKRRKYNEKSMFKHEHITNIFKGETGREVVQGKFHLINSERK